MLVYAFTIVAMTVRATAFTAPTLPRIPARLVFVQQPVDALEGCPLSPVIKVVVEDADGLVASTATNLVRLNLTGVYGLGGKLKVAARRGVARFSDLIVSFSGSYTLTASSPGLLSATSSTFAISIPTIGLLLPGSSISVGSTLSGVVRLERPAGAGGTTVSLKGLGNAITLLQAAVQVGPGQSAGAFSYTAVSPGVSMLNATAPGFVSATVEVTARFAPIPATYLGLSVGQVGIVPSDILFGTTRSWDDSPDLSWSAENPSKGVYDFTTLDYFIDDCEANKVEMIYTFGRTPRWASSRPDIAAAYGPGQCAPPTDLALWDGYVQAIAAHSAGRIKYWELWNEPQDQQYYCGDIPTMVAMAQHAANIIKRVDPSALVLSPAVAGPDGTTWISTFLSTGGASVVDVLAFHGYRSATAEDVLPVVSSYKTVSHTYGRPGMQMWDTEDNWAGYGNLPTPSSTQQVGFLAKSYLLQWSAGVSRFVWYQYGGGFWGGLQASSSGPNAAAIALQQMYLWMVGASPAGPCSKSASGVWTCGFTRPGGYEAEAIWISGSSVTLSVPSKYVEYLDLAGMVHPGTNGSVTIGDQPILLENQALP